MVQLLLLDRLAVDERAVRTSEVDHPELLTTSLEPGMVTARRGVAEDHVVVRRPAHAQRVVTGAVTMPRVRS